MGTCAIDCLESPGTVGKRLHFWCCFELHDILQSLDAESLILISISTFESPVSTTPFPCLFLILVLVTPADCPVFNLILIIRPQCVPMNPSQRPPISFMDNATSGACLRSWKIKIGLISLNCETFVMGVEQIHVGVGFENVSTRVECAVLSWGRFRSF